MGDGKELRPGISGYIKKPQSECLSDTTGGVYGPPRVDGQENSRLNHPSISTGLLVQIKTRFPIENGELIFGKKTVGASQGGLSGACR